MKKTLSTIVAGTLLALPVVAVTATTAEAAQRYGTCKALNKDYSSGISKAKGLPNRHARQMSKPLEKRTIVDRKNRPVNADLYNANARLDFDKDGIACER